MEKTVRILTTCLGLILCLLLITNTSAAKDQAKDDPLDIINYRIEAELIPETHSLKANADVTFRLNKPSQSVIFEMNGSLKVSSIKTAEGKELTFIQDSLDALNLRIDLGGVAPVNQDITLKFQYEGQLIGPQGGVLANKRLAYIGSEGSYLTYASRWFPFHGYAADTATYEISLITPSELTAVGLSTEPVEVKTYQPVAPPPLEPAKPNTNKPEEPKPNKPPVKRPTKPRRTSSLTATQTDVIPVAYYQPFPQDSRKISKFVSRTPVLPGTFAISRYSTISVKNDNVEVNIYIKPGSEVAAQKYAEEASKAVNFYATKFGAYAFGKNLSIAEIDNDSLDTTTSAGIFLLAEKIFKLNETPTELLYRETAYQWWGQAVTLKSFDDAWVCQGLAQYSALLMQEKDASEPVFRDLARGAMERALAFEAQTSISRAPIELDDQSEAYRSIVVYKGAFVYRMLRLIVGEDKFEAILKSYYEQYRGHQSSITDFENVASKVYGKDLRYFFGQWVDSTGVPEFHSTYQILRTKNNSFKVRGSINQESEAFSMPIDVEFRYEGGADRQTLNLTGKSVDFSFEAKGKPLDIVVDPDSKILKISDDIRVSVIVRRGIEYFHNEEYTEAEQQFMAAIKLYRASSWAWYNLGLLYVAQKNFPKANDAFSEALELDLQPRWVEVWSYIKRGNCYDALGQRDRAVAEYQKAIQLGDTTDGAQQTAQKYLSTPYRRDDNN